jgi:hypothetical protein
MEREEARGAGIQQIDLGRYEVAADGTWRERRQRDGGNGG